jgi:UPF0176 protein
MDILNACAYKFVDIDDLQVLRVTLRERALAAELKGTILLAPEGINLFLAGTADRVEGFLEFLLADPRFNDMPVKKSRSNEQAFNRMLVKVKREIISMRQPEIRPAGNPAPRLSPQELKRWLDEGREMLLLDTRNQFEVDLGTFEGAKSLGLASFGEFASAAECIDRKDLPVVTFCTGGIRCEKAAPWLIAQGFREVYQLDGGILKYFEDCGRSHFSGECFVFDKRVALDAELKPTATAPCYVCQAIVTPEQQASADYAVGVSCPHCVGLERRRLAA